MVLAIQCCVRFTSSGLSNGTMPLSAMIATSKMGSVFQDKDDPDKMFA